MFRYHSHVFHKKAIFQLFAHLCRNSSVFHSWCNVFLFAISTKCLCYSLEHMWSFQNFRCVGAVRIFPESRIINLVVFSVRFQALMGGHVYECEGGKFIHYGIVLHWLLESLHNGTVYPVMQGRGVHTYILPPSIQCSNCSGRSGTNVFICYWELIQTLLSC